MGDWHKGPLGHVPVHVLGPVLGHVHGHVLGHVLGQVLGHVPAHVLFSTRAAGNGKVSTLHARYPGMCMACARPDVWVGFGAGHRRSDGLVTLSQCHVLIPHRHACIPQCG